MKVRRGRRKLTLIEAQKNAQLYPKSTQIYRTLVRALFSTQTGGVAHAAKKRSGNLLPSRVIHKRMIDDMDCAIHASEPGRLRDDQHRQPVGNTLGIAPVMGPARSAMRARHSAAEISGRVSEAGAPECSRRFRHWIDLPEEFHIDGVESAQDPSAPLPYRPTSRGFTGVIAAWVAAKWEN
jgi:hypothetical protein